MPTLMAWEHRSSRSHRTRRPTHSRTPGLYGRSPPARLVVEPVPGAPLAHGCEPLHANGRDLPASGGPRAGCPMISLHPRRPGMTDPSSTGKAIQYAIEVEGVINPRWSEWFNGLSVSVVPSQTDAGRTLLLASLPDQSALPALLARVTGLKSESHLGHPELDPRYKLGVRPCQRTCHSPLRACPRGHPGSRTGSVYSPPAPTRSCRASPPSAM